MPARRKGIWRAFTYAAMPQRKGGSQSRVRPRLTLSGSAGPLPLAAAIVMLLGLSRPVAPVLNRVAHGVLVVTVTALTVVPGRLVVTMTPMLFVALVPNHRWQSVAWVIGTVVSVMAGWIAVVAILAVFAVVIGAVITVAGVLMHGTPAQRDQPEKQHEKT